MKENTPAHRSNQIYNNIFNCVTVATLCNNMSLLSISQKEVFPQQNRWCLNNTTSWVLQHLQLCTDNVTHRTTWEIYLVMWESKGESRGVGADRGQGAHGAEVWAAWASYVQFEESRLLSAHEESCLTVLCVDEIASVTSLVFWIWAICSAGFSRARGVQHLSDWNPSSDLLAWFTYNPVVTAVMHSNKTSTISVHMCGEGVCVCVSAPGSTKAPGFSVFFFH